MICRIIKPFNRRGKLQHPGNIIDVPEDMLQDLEEYVQAIVSEDNYSDGKHLPHYCEPGGCWCGAKLQEFNHPTDCIAIDCEYHAHTAEPEVELKDPSAGSNSAKPTPKGERT